MKKIFKVDISFILFILILSFSGYLNYAINFLIVISFHELGHIIMIKLLGYQITSINFYPLGAIIKTNININIPSHKLFLISISGILMQILLFIFIPKSISNYSLFKLINTSLIIYNLLPIYPLDGYKIFLSLLEPFFSYSYIIKIFYLISFFSLFLLLYYTKSIINFIYLYYLNIFYLLNYSYYMHKFLLERYLYNIKYRKIKYINKLNKLFKTRYNYIKCDNIYIEENKVLSKIFTRFY